MRKKKSEEMVGKASEGYKAIALAFVSESKNARFLKIKKGLEK